jgi:hypothetical protein
MLLDEMNLGRIVRIVGDDFLDPTGVCHLEYVGCLAEVEWHDLLAHVVNRGLAIAGGLCGGAEPADCSEGRNDTEDNSSDRG